MEPVQPERPVLVIGLDPRRVPGPWDPEPVVAAIEDGMASLVRNGFAAESCLVGLDGSDDIEAMVVTALQSRRWECVLVGGGIRTAEDLLVMFESIVNLVHSYAPQAGIAFGSSPADLLDSIIRRLGPAASAGGRTSAGRPAASPSASSGQEEAARRDATSSDSFGG